MNRLIIILIILAFSGKLLSQNNSTKKEYKLGDKIEIGQILFEYNTGELLSESKNKLDSLALLLIENDSLIIEIGNHSDGRGSRKYSRCLTCKRAESVKEYLISKGLNDQRLTNKGYWGEKPIIPMDKIKKMKTPQVIEQAHQVNRRTEFIVVKIHKN